MKAPVKIALVTTCKGRLASLKESIETWLDLEYDDYYILVVDYDCPDGTREFIEKKKEGYLKRSKTTGIHVVKVANKPHFNINDARNIGIQNTQPGTELLFMIDSDVHIKNKKILKRLYRDYKRGAVFFSNLPVLSSRYFEGLMYYRHEYRQEVEAPSVLPVISEGSGTAGTACFTKEIYDACGGYNEEVSRLGHGGHDVEFYLRYLNTFFYSYYSNRPAINQMPVGRALDAVLEHFDLFPSGFMKDNENPEEAKLRFYPDESEAAEEEPDDTGKIAFIHYIHRFFKQFDWSRYANIEIKPVSLQEEDFDRFSLPIPFRHWFACWYGKTLFDQNQLETSQYYFGQLIKSDRVKADYLATAYFFLGEIQRREGRGQARGFYFRSLTQLLGKRQKNDKDLYYIGSLYQRLGKYEKARHQFEKILGSEQGNYLHPRIYYRLGEMEFREGKYAEANFFFEKTLSMVQSHPKAADYIDRINKEQS
ncbi:MAG: tetratricopeptide repeat protein [bacterium]|nr:tetratricopeptide repeat protein [bacterium]